MIRRVSTGVMGLFLSSQLYAAALNQNMPSEVALYLRVPALLSWASDGQEGRPLAKAMAHPKHQAAIGQLREAISRLDDLPAAYADPLKFVFAEQIGPLEFAAISDGGVLSPLSAILLRTQVRSGDATFKKRFQTMLGGLGGDSMPFTLDAKTGELSILLGAGVTPERLAESQALFSPAHAAKNLAFSKAQNQIDGSGTGFLLWANMKAMAPILGMAAASSSDPTDAAVIEALQKFDSLAIGAGSVGKGAQSKGRLALEMVFDPKGKPEWTQYWKPSRSNFDYRFAGEPDWAFQFAIPTEKQQLDALIKAFDAKASADKASTQEGGESQSLAKMFATPIGAGPSVRQLLEAIGPEAALFGDEAGYFFALRVRNKPVFREVVGELSKFGSYQVKNGTHRLIVDYSKFSVLSQSEEDLSESESDSEVGKNPLEEFAALMRANASHVFWREEQDWVVLAQVPQVLRDRQAIGTKLTAENWIQNHLGAQHKGTGFALYSRTDNMPRYFWHSYLATLHGLAYIAKTDLDLDALPSARELGLPTKGMSGFSMDYNEEQLSFGIDYDTTFVDLVGSQSAAGSVAVIAILAAVALPAYQDFNVRAEVGKARLLADYAGSDLSEQAAKSRTKAQEFKSAANTSLRWDGALLVLEFSENHGTRELRGKTLAFSPRENEQGDWTFDCGFQGNEAAVAATTIAPKHLPVNCRTP